MRDPIAVTAARVHQAVMAQREEILRAFVAQHGCLPDEAVQIEQRMADGSLRWWVERRDTREWPQGGPVDGRSGGGAA